MGVVRPSRSIAASYVVPGPSGVSVRDRLRGLTVEDERVLRLLGRHLGSLASGDLKVRCADGSGHSAGRWAARKRELTSGSSSRWAGSITKSTHDQWALARRCRAAHVRALETGVAMIRHRLSLPVGAPGGKGAPGGYRSKHEWFVKSRRLAALADRLTAVQGDLGAGRVRVVRGGRRLLNTRHHLGEAGLSGQQWRARWEAARWFLSADGESGKRGGNETIRVTLDGEVSIRLPAPLAHLANARHGRYVLASSVEFRHRGGEWADQVGNDLAVAYRVHHDADRGRWYITASWQRPPTPAIPWDTARAAGVVGVDFNADHLACHRLDRHGNPVGGPHRFFFDLSGTAAHRDAQIRHALTRLLHWAEQTGVTAIAVEDLDFSTEKTREKHGRRKRFRQLISGMPTGKLKARLVSMAAVTGIAIVAVDPAYTSRWGDQHWRKPLTTGKRTMTRHDAAAVAIGRRALGHPIRRRTAPPHDDRSDRRGHRTAQTAPGDRRRDGNRPPTTDHAHRSVPPNGTRTRRPSTSTTVRDVRSDQQRVQDPLLLAD
ncbi:IS605 OrfB family transposase [Saccharothrix ecbatanensis]|uniref:IS605 OrfB family transposase n=1 Tax=Saccharothrix ecbatanensis TaxID=1105145 RepID=A0A7W9M4X0_9PSEU|nr:transposase [Saccharothrix ecbatanensis]MBB5807566.1 IS605 OrfB family transposase [Saccharothrix ecbatanensis]